MLHYNNNGDLFHRMKKIIKIASLHSFFEDWISKGKEKRNVYCSTPLNATKEKPCVS